MRAGRGREEEEASGRGRREEEGGRTGSVNPQGLAWPGANCAKFLARKGDFLCGNSGPPVGKRPTLQDGAS